MSASKHTPWAVHSLRNARRYIVPASHASRRIGASSNPEDDQERYAMQIATVSPDWHGRFDADEIACLIAAAPDLLEAAKAVAQWVNQRPDTHPYEAWKQLEAAIAKAEGRS